MTQTIDRPIVTDADAKALFAAIGQDKPNGPVLAALLSSGIGVTALGLLTTIAAGSANFANLLKINAQVGPLSGKTTYAVAAFFASWIVAAVIMRGKNYDERKFLTATFVLIGIGILGTFPIFYDIFAPKRAIDASAARLNVRAAPPSSAPSESHRDDQTVMRRDRSGARLHL